MSWRILFLGLVLLALLTTVVSQGDDDAEEPIIHDDSGEEETSGTGESDEKTDDGDEQHEAEGISARCIFTNFPDRHFPAGEVVESLIGFQNRDDEAYRVEYIRGSLTSSVDFTYYIQNFTGALHNTTVASGEETCLVYRFKAEATVEPRAYGLILQVFFTSDSNETFLSTVFNGTIEITDASSGFDGKTVFAYLSMAGMIGFVGYVVFRIYEKQSGGKKSAFGKVMKAVSSPTAPAPENEAKAGGVDWDFISDRHKQYVGGRRRSGSPPTSSPTRK